MKKNNLKKIFSAFAVLAVSAGVICAIPLAGCGKNSAPTNGNDANDTQIKTVTIDTALGTTQSRSSGRTFWVGPNGVFGKTDVANTAAEPYNIETVLDIPTGEDAAKVELQHGDTVILMPGVYTGLTNSIHIRPSGAFNSYIEIRPATVEDGLTAEQAAVNGGKVTLDFSEMRLSDSNRGIQIYGDYIYWHDIDVCGAGDNGIFVAGKYNTVEHCDLYNNRDTGLQLGREASSMTHINQWPAYNLIKNVSSHNNYDNGPTFGENADGFGGKLSIGYGNVFDGCIAYRNCDDGWDLFAYASNGNIGTILIENCVAYENGFLEYTRNECNVAFDAEYVTKDEKANPYDTSCGDGNGFKLGGQIMEGDVVVRNSIAYGNKLHGITDNSNPGLIRIENVTSFDNNAYINAETGLVDRAYGGDGAANIDLSRWDYSYNSVVNSLSAVSGRFNVSSDNYRGSIMDSVFQGYKVIGSANLNTREQQAGENFTNPAAADIFVELPVDGSTYNLSGLGSNANGPAHTALRNSDGSVNLGNVLKLKADADQKLIPGKTIGADLSKTGWEQYDHYYTDNTLEDLKKESEELAKLQVAYNTLELACNPKAVYQPFDVVHNMHDINVSWESSDENVAVPGTAVDNSALSGAEFITIDIFRDSSADKTVTLTATLSIGDQKLTKDFEITVKQGVSKIGEVSVVTPGGEILGDGQSTSTIVDRFDLYKEPTVQVRDALYPDSVKYLRPEQYTVEKTYYYQADASIAPVKVKGFTPSNAGIFDITVKATLKSDNSSSSMTYRIYVASEFAKADFSSDANVTLYRDGFIISGIPSSATGIVYAVASAQPLTLTGSDIKATKGVQSYSYRDTSLNVKFNMANKSAYYIYYAVANARGEITSQVYEQTIGCVEISTAADFKKVVQGTPIDSENPETTVYLLTEDIDLSGQTGWVAEGTFKGLLNGMGHTVENLQISGTDNNKASIFAKVEGGTVMNIKFKDISITNTKNNTGIVAQCFGGYFHNIVLEHLTVKGVQRSGGLIGMLRESSLPTEISQVYVDNTTTITNGGGEKTKTTRAAGIIGAFYYEKDAASGGKFDVKISDCLVSATIDTNDSDGASGFIGEIDSNGKTKSAEDCYIELNNCVFNGKSYGGSHRNGGLVGYFKNPCILKANGCVSIGAILYDDTSAGIVKGEMTVSKKNISGMFGGFVASAQVTATNCISLFEEYEDSVKEYIVVYSKDSIKNNGASFLVNILKFDTTSKLSLVYDATGATNNEGIKLLAEPFISLNFLES